MNQAETVPTTAHSAVTTTVRLTVFQISCAVSPRKRSGSRVPHPTWTACVTQEDERQHDRDGRHQRAQKQEPGHAAVLTAPTTLMTQWRRAGATTPPA